MTNSVSGKSKSSVLLSATQIAQLLSFLSAAFALLALALIIVVAVSQASDSIGALLAFTTAWLLPVISLSAYTGLLILKGQLNFAPWALGTALGMQLLLLGSGQRDLFVLWALASPDKSGSPFGFFLLALDLSLLGLVVSLVLVLKVLRQTRVKSADNDSKSSALRTSGYLMIIAGILAVTSLIDDFSSEYSISDLPIDLIFIAGSALGVFFILKTKLGATLLALVATLSVVILNSVMVGMSTLGTIPLPLVGALVSAFDMGEYWRFVFVQADFIRGISFWLLFAALIIIRRSTKDERDLKSNPGMIVHGWAKRFAAIGGFIVGLSILVALARVIASAVSTYWNPNEFLFIWVLFVVGIYFFVFSISALIADAAAKKARSWRMFFWLSALVSPVIMAIIVAAMSSPSQGTGESASVNSRASNSDVAEKLRQLEELKAQGLITSDEFATRRKNVLDHI